MNLSNIVGTLTGVLSSQSQYAVKIAQEGLDASAQLKAGELTLDEYKEVMTDLETEQLIHVEASALAEQEALASLFEQIKVASTIFTTL